MISKKTKLTKEEKKIRFLKTQIKDFKRHGVDEDIIYCLTSKLRKLELKFEKKQLQKEKED